MSRSVPEGLQVLLEDGLIHAIVRPLKSGKEADLFVVERRGELCIAKVYRQFRSFKNDAGYREGRTVRSTGAQRAMSKRSRYGQKLAERIWHSAEVDALRRLAEAGARVPRVLAYQDGVVVMEMIAGAEGDLAPQLAEVPLSPEEARAMCDAVLDQVVLMLLNDLVHGDLSPYNILLVDDGPVIIDLPQCVSAAHNQQAAAMLERDVHAITRHLGLVDPAIRALDEHAWQLWAEYERGTLTRGFRPDPTRVRDTGVGDLHGLVSFVRTAGEEAALERRASTGDPAAVALLAAAERRAARKARRATEAAQQGSGGSAGPRPKSPADARNAPTKAPSPDRARRQPRRRRRRG